jgi:1-acyl-sn-glycerol-3-phosphate acyltransferase
MDERLRALTDTLLDEIVNAVGLRKTLAARQAFGLFFRRAADRLSAIGLNADRIIAAEGFPAACAWMMSHWVRGVTTRGAETMPTEGPLLVVSNHVGAYDIVVVPSQIPRPDLKIISSDIHYLKNLPHACEHLIFLSDEAHERMAAARAGIRQLKEGGSLLLFATGRIDPDPALSDEAEAHLEKWSPSIDLFLRMVPQAKVVLSITSGFLTQRWLNHPLTRLRKVDWEKRRIAEFGQVLQQLFRPGTLFVSPAISFAPPVTVAELGENPRQKLIEQAKRLLASHLSWAARPLAAA